MSLVHYDAIFMLYSFLSRFPLDSFLCQCISSYVFFFFINFSMKYRFCCWFASKNGQYNFSILNYQMSPSLVSKMPSFLIPKLTVSSSACCGHGDLYTCILRFFRRRSTTCSLCFSLVLLDFRRPHSSSVSLKNGDAATFLIFLQFSVPYIQ